MQIVVSGSTGTIGSALCRHLMDQGHHVRRLVRPNTLTNPNKAPLGTTIDWDPQAGTIDPKALEGTDVVINLAGESVVGCWTTQKMYRILDSRVETTSLLANTIADLITPPKLFLNASAVGYYGNRKDEVIDESTPSGGGFLAEVSRRWEQAAAPADTRGIRTAFLRFGMVLTPRGGALKSMLPVFRLGLGGPIGKGNQFWPWISIDDTTEAIAHLIDRDDTQGPYNIVAPNAATCNQFTRSLGRVLHRPAMLGMPETLVTLLAGGFADELLFSKRVVPQRLLDAGYAFKHTNLNTTLKQLSAA